MTRPSTEDPGAAKRKMMFLEFKNASETIIDAVIGANGPAAGRVPPEELWQLHLSAVAWRERGGKTINEVLKIIKLLDDGELKELQKNISGDCIISFLGKLLLKSPFGDPRVELIKLLPPAMDDELEKILKEKTEKIVIHHDILGDLAYDRTVDWYQGSIKWLKQKVELNISVDDEGGYIDSVDTALSLLNDMRTWDCRIKEYAISRLLSLKNESWLNEGESAISSQEFTKRMKLEAITVYPMGRFEFMHNDGDLFWGHAIQICGSLKAGLTDADIPG